MLTDGIRHLPVVDDGRLVGIVDLSDLCRVLFSRTPVRRPTPDGRTHDTRRGTR
jgi:signal-transduction protein with cAMP-binding, CBS, and nucleotidyltransferase domain